MSRIAVIGAGLAGLSAARDLEADGHEVHVFEARDRVGGRVWSDTIGTLWGPRVIERGAEFVLDNYDTMRALAADAGLQLVDTGMSYYVREPGDLEHYTAADIVEAGKHAASVLDRIDDDATAEDVLGQLDTNPVLVDALRSRIEISTAVSSRDVTAQALRNVASFEPLASWRITGGNQRLPIALAAALSRPVRLQEPVIAVEQAADSGVQVALHDGSDEHFDAVVVALPLGVLRAADSISTPTSYTRELALRRVVQGHAVKLHAPLVAAAKTSAVMSVTDRFWTWTALDVSGDVVPVLNSFMGSSEAIERSGVTNDPGSWLEHARALRPELNIGDDAIATVWSTDPYARGAYTAHAPGSGGGDFALEQPIGDVYFAGEYAEPVYTGLMEGAILSGRRAAARITASDRTKELTP